MREAGGEGLARRRSQGPDLSTPSRGIRVPWDVAQEFTEAVRPVFELTPGGVGCFGTAARLLGISVPGWVQSEPRLHVARTGTTAANRFGVVGHRLKLAAGETSCVRGIAVTSPARTWLDLASVLTPEDLVAAGDSVVCAHRRSFEPERRPLAHLDELATVVDRHKGVRGILAARHALTLIRVGADSPPETYLRLAVLRRLLPEPDLDVVVLGPDGRELAWPDLAFRRFRVAVQYDGRHHLTAGQQESDARRDNDTVLAGWIPVRITGAMIAKFGYEGAARIIRDALISRGWARQP